MKTQIILVLSILALTASAQTEKGDTLLNATSVNKLVIVDGAEGLTIQAIADGDSVAAFDYHQNYPDNVSVHSHRREYRASNLTSPEINLSKTENPRWEHYGFSDGICFGFNAASATGAKIDPWQSADISWLNVMGYKLQPRDSRHAFTAGFGFSWRNFRMTDGQQFHFDGEQLSTAPFASNVAGDWSRVKVFSLSVPLLWNCHLSRHHEFKLGPIVNFNTHSSIRSHYQEGNRDVCVGKTIKVHAPVTVDIFASITIYRCIGLYVRYSPMNILKGSTGMDFKPLSFGIMF